MLRIAAGGLRPLAAALLAIAMLTVASVAPAEASTRNKIIKDCADDGVLQGKYSPSDLRDARQNLPSDVAEYTDCADVLRRAEVPDTSGGAGGGTSGGGTGFGGAGAGAAAAAGVGSGPLITPTTDADRDALASAQDAGRQPVTIGGEQVVPGQAGLSGGAVRNGIPASVVFALVLLAFAGGALAIPAIRKGLPALRHGFPVLVARLRP